MTKWTEVRLERTFRPYTDAHLAAAWEAIDKDRVKSGRNKGFIKLKAAAFGDLILKEQARRRRAAEARS